MANAATFSRDYLQCSSAMNLCIEPLYILCWPNCPHQQNTIKRKYKIKQWFTAPGEQYWSGWRWWKEEEQSQVWELLEWILTSLIIGKYPLALAWLFIYCKTLEASNFKSYLVFTDKLILQSPLWCGNFYQFEGNCKDKTESDIIFLQCTFQSFHVTKKSCQRWNLQLPQCSISCYFRVRFICTEDQKVSAFLLTSLGILGVTANIMLIIVICFKGSFKRKLK